MIKMKTAHDLCVKFLVTLQLKLIMNFKLKNEFFIFNHRKKNIPVLFKKLIP